MCGYSRGGQNTGKMYRNTNIKYFHRNLFIHKGNCYLKKYLNTKYKYDERYLMIFKYFFQILLNYVV